MDSKDLMIGDWVKGISSAIPNKIECVGSSTVKLKGDGWYSEEFIHPIPLTPEILEKNGWKKCNGDLYVFMTETAAPLCMEWNDSNKALFINDGLVPNPICNVHQLQHALRLCGIEKEITL